jgi:hypothetical protein
VVSLNCSGVSPETLIFQGDRPLSQKINSQLRSPIQNLPTNALPLTFRQPPKTYCAIAIYCDRAWMEMENSKFKVQNGECWNRISNFAFLILHFELSTAIAICCDRAWMEMENSKCKMQNGECWSRISNFAFLILHFEWLCCMNQSNFRLNVLLEKDFSIRLPN